MKLAGILMLAIMVMITTVQADVITEDYFPNVLTITSQDNAIIAGRIENLLLINQFTMTNNETPFDSYYMTFGFVNAGSRFAGDAQTNVNYDVMLATSAKGGRFTGDAQIEEVPSFIGMWIIS